MPNYYYFLYYRVDGGVSRNDYICQMIANVTSTTVVRMKNSNRTEVTCLGAAFMAGLSSGVCRYIIYRYISHIHSSQIQFFTNWISIAWTSIRSC